MLPSSKGSNSVPQARPKVTLEPDNWWEYNEELQRCSHAYGMAGEELRADEHWDLLGQKPQEPERPPWLHAPKYTVPELSMRIAKKGDSASVGAGDSGTSTSLAADQTLAPSSQYEDWESYTSQTRKRLEMEYDGYVKVFTTKMAQWEAARTTYLRDRGFLFNMLMETTGDKISKKIQLDATVYEPARDTADSLAIYRAQRKFCTASSAANTTAIMNSWRTCSQNGKPLDDHIIKWEARYGAVAMVQPPTEGGKVMQFYGSLDQHWKDLLSDVGTRNEKSPDLQSYEYYKSRLQDYQTNNPGWEDKMLAEAAALKAISSKKARQSSDGTQAYSAAPTQSSGKRQKTAGQKGPPPAHKMVDGKPFCTNCEGVGHHKGNCTVEKVICNQCGLKGHLGRYCEPRYKNYARKHGFSPSKPQTVAPWERTTTVALAMPLVGTKRSNEDQGTDDNTVDLTADSQGGSATGSQAQSATDSLAQSAKCQRTERQPNPVPVIRTLREFEEEGLLLQMGKGHPQPGRGRGFRILASRLTSAKHTRDPLVPIREISWESSRDLERDIMEGIKSVNEKIAESIRTGRRPDATLIPLTHAMYPKEAYESSPCYWMEHKVHVPHVDQITTILYREANGRGSFDRPDPACTVEELREWKQERVKNRDPSWWESLSPDERRAQFEVLTRTPAEGTVTEKMLLDWLYWYPHHNSLTTMGRNICPGFDMPTLKDLVPAYMPTGYRFLWQWCKSTVPEIAEVIPPRSPSVSVYEIMLRAYRTWRVWPDGEITPSGDPPDYGDSYPSSGEEDDETDNRKDGSVGPAPDPPDNSKGTSSGNSHGSSSGTHAVSYSAMDEPWSVAAQNRHKVVLRGEALYYESGERKSPDTIRMEEDALALTRAYMVKARLSLRDVSVPPILLDTGAGAHIFSEFDIVRHYVQPVSANEEMIESFGGHLITATHSGDIPGFGRVLVTPASEVTLISGSQLDRNGYETRIGDGKARISRPGRAAIDAPRTDRDLYEISREDLRSMLQPDGISAYSANGPLRVPLPLTSNHTPEQVRRATEVAKLHSTLNHPSEAVLMAALDNAVILGTSLSAADVNLWRKVYGPCPSCQAAKTRRPHYSARDRPPAEGVGERLHLDLYTFKKSTIGGNTTVLVGVDDYSDYLTVIPVVNKEHSHLLKGLKETVATYTRHGHECTEVCTDHEAAFLACSTELGLIGIELRASPPYQHSQRVERHIQTLLAHARAVLYGLAYVLPPSLYGELLIACGHSLNALPNSKRPGVSPYSMLTGRKLNAQEGLQRFGALAMANEAGKPHTALDKRADMVIILGPAKVSYGSYRVYSLTTKRVHTRHQFVPLEHLPTDFPFPRQSLTMDIEPLCERYAEPSTATLVARPEEAPVLPQFPALVELRRVDTLEAPAGESDDDDSITVLSNASRAFIAPPTTDGSNQPAVDRLTEEVSSPPPTEVASEPSEGEAQGVAATALPLRRSTRERIPRRWYDSSRLTEEQYSTAYKISIKEGLSSRYAQQCKEAIRAEIHNMLHYHVGTYVRYEDIPYHLRRNVLQSFMFLKHKTTPSGEYERTKARLVGNGAHQGDHMYNLVASATVYLTSVYVIMNIASYHWCSLISIDIKGAFLNAKFEKEDPVTYIRVNKEVTQEWLHADPTSSEYVGTDGQLTLKLDKFIYGLKQAPYKFQQHLVAFLERIGYTKLVNDECVFMKRAGDQWSYLCTHVDDILQASNSQMLIDELRDELKKEFEDITYHPKADAYVGLSIEHIQRMEAFHLTQKGLVQKTIDEYLANDNKPNPADPASDELLKAESGDQTPADRKIFLSLVMTLMYVARLTRPDILLAVTVLSTRCTKPTAQDMKHALRVLRYLRGTIGHGILIQCTSLNVHGSSDSSHNIHGDGKGHTGFVISMGPTNSIVHVRSVKQKLTAQSSTDAELIALNECSKMVVHIRQLLQEMGIVPSGESVIEQDNRSAILLSEEKGSSKRSKYLLPKIGYIRDLIKLGKIRVDYAPTDMIRSDSLTKPLHGHSYMLKTQGLVRESPIKSRYPQEGVLGNIPAERNKRTRGNSVV